MKPARLGPAWWLFALCAVAALSAIAFVSVRAGGYVLAAALVLAAVLRLGPDRFTAGLAVRSRTVDAATLLVFATAVVFIFSVVSL